MPLFVPKGIEAQPMMDRMKLIGPSGSPGVEGIVADEVKWIESYKEDELSGNDKLTAEGGYALGKIPFDYSPTGGGVFSKFFIDTVVAKGDVGLATHNNWAIQNLVEIYEIECAAGNVIDITTMMPVVFTAEDARYIRYVYSRLVQDLVVRGIKHNIGGSDGFKPFLMPNMCNPKYAPSVMKFLKSEMGVPVEIIHKMMAMIHWGMELTKFTDSIMQFITMFNRGRFPNPERVVEGHFNYIVDKTFYGKLTRPLYDIRHEVEEWKSKGWSHSGDINSFIPQKPNNAIYGTYSEYGSNADADESMVNPRPQQEQYEVPAGAFSM